jgi:hypothetical protein
MIRVVEMFKMANEVGSEWFVDGNLPMRFLDRDECQRQATKLNVEICASPGYLRATACFVLEVSQERGESLFFDLPNPLMVVKSAREDGDDGRAAQIG